ncbi:MAG: ImmA/IrrE family metallo-endopeptidase [Myxococcales bacterium]
MTSREQVLVDVARWLENYNELEAMLDMHVAYRFEPLVGELAKKRRGPERAREAAKRARTALDLRPDDSIRDICGLLEERGGVKVFPMHLASDAFFGLSVARDDGGPAVVVNVWDRISVERWVFSAAHELGHLLLHLGAYDAAQTEEDREEEGEANQFASHFLMPHELFVREWDEARGLPLVDRVLKVKRIFRVSYRTVLYRLSEQEAYGKRIWQQFQVAYKARYGQSLGLTDEPAALSPGDFSAAMVESRAADEPKRLSREDFIEDRLCRLVRSAFEKELISLGRAAEVLSIDIKTMRTIVSTWVE